MKTNLQLTKTIATALFVITLLGMSPALFAQVKIGANPTVIGSTSNLEVEGSVGGDISKMAVTKDSAKVGIGTATPTNKLHVKSAGNPVRLEGLLSGTGNETVLTVDANGVVKKQPTTTPVPTVRLTATLSGNYNSASNGALKIVPLDVIQSSDGNFSTVTHLYTVPTTGTYQISGCYDGLSYHEDGSLSIGLSIVINSTDIVFLTSVAGDAWPANTTSSTRMAGSATLKLNAGNTISLSTTSCHNCTPTTTYTGIPGYTNMTIVKLD